MIALAEAPPRAARRSELIRRDRGRFPAGSLQERAVFIGRLPLAAGLDNDGVLQRVGGRSASVRCPCTHLLLVRRTGFPTRDREQRRQFADHSGRPRSSWSASPCSTAGEPARASSPAQRSAMVHISRRRRTALQTRCSRCCRSRRATAIAPDMHVIFERQSTNDPGRAVRTLVTRRSP